MNRFLELKSKFKILAVLATLGLCVGFVGIKAANLPTAATDATIYTGLQTLAGGEDIGVTNNGIAWLIGGLTLSGGTGNVTVSTPAPLGGTLTLAADPVLLLLGDLTLGSGVTIGASGNVNAAGYAIVLNGQLSLGASDVTFVTGAAVIEGNGNIIDFGTGSLIASGGTLTIKNAILQNPNFTGSTQTIILENVVIEITSPSASIVAITFDGTNVVVGSNTFTCDSDITINAGASLSFDRRNFTYSSGTFTNNGTLHFNGNTVTLGNNFTIGAGTVLFENRVVVTGGSTFDISAAATKVLSGATVELAGNAVLDV